LFCSGQTLVSKTFSLVWKSKWAQIGDVSIEYSLVDECASGLDTCPSGTYCVDKVAGFECHATAGMECSGAGCDSNNNCVNPSKGCTFVYKPSTGVGGSVKWPTDGTNVGNPTYTCTTGSSQNQCSNLFDGNENTFWQGTTGGMEPHKVTIKFNQPGVDFSELRWKAHPSAIYHEQYRNVCLFVDNVEKTCTLSNKITTAGEWISMSTGMIIRNAKTVELRWPAGVTGVAAEIEVIYNGLSLSTGDCPECWEYKDGKCQAKKGDDSCFKLDCKYDKMNLDFSSTLFGIADNETPIPFEQNAAAVSFDGSRSRWATSCSLGQCGMTCEQRDIDGVSHMVFGVQVTVARKYMDVNGMKVAMRNPIRASITFECAYRQEVKISSTEFDVHSVDAHGSSVQFGDLTTGFTLSVFTDDKFTIPITEDNLYIGSPVYSTVEWKVTGANTIVGFFVDQCQIVSNNQEKMNLIERNCYSQAFNAQQLQEKKIVTKKSQFKFTSFVVGKGNDRSQFKINCNVKMCSFSDKKCDKMITREDSACPAGPFQYKALTFN